MAELRQELVAFADEVAAKIEAKALEYGDSHEYMTLGEHENRVARETLELLHSSRRDAPTEAVDVAACAFLLWRRFRPPRRGGGTP